MLPSSWLHLGIAALTFSSAACSSKPDRFDVAVEWVSEHALPGCKRRLLRVDVTTTPAAAVTAAGVHATADSDGKARLEIRAGALAGSKTLIVERDGSGARKEVPVPAPGEPRTVELVGERPKEWAWSGKAAGALLYPSVSDVFGDMDGAELRFTFTGCDLRGGTAVGGTIVSKGPDAVEARFPVATQLTSIKSVGSLSLPLELEIENTDGARGKLTLTGTLDAATALAAVHAASGGAPVPGAPAWQKGAANAIVVAGPSLSGLDRANRLLLDQPVDRAAGIVVLGIEHAPSDKMCTGYKDVYGGLPKGATTKRAIVKAKLVERSTGKVLAEQTFENEAECPYSLTSVDGRVEPVEAGPAWDPILTWLEQQHDQ